MDRHRRQDAFFLARFTGLRVGQCLQQFRQQRGMVAIGEQRRGAAQFRHAVIRQRQFEAQPGQRFAPSRGDFALAHGQRQRQRHQQRLRMQADARTRRAQARVGEPFLRGLQVQQAQALPGLGQ